MLDKIFQIAFVSAMVVLGYLAQGASKRAYRIDFCHVYYEESDDTEPLRVDTNIWSDQWEKYIERWPESHCGRCAKPQPCPEETTKEH